MCLKNGKQAFKIKINQGHLGFLATATWPQQPGRGHAMPSRGLGDLGTLPDLAAMDLDPIRAIDFYDHCPIRQIGLI